MKKCILAILLLSSAALHADEQEKHPISLLFGWSDLKPMSNNHTYAYDVAGTQPYFQDWHAQVVNPHYSSTWELGMQYAIKDNQYNLTVDWLHLNSSDSASKQGNQTLNLADIEFIAPPFEMSPPVFGIRRADAKLKYDFDNIAINLEKLFYPYANTSIKMMTGLNIIRLKQNMTTIFSDYVGSLPTDYSYALPADPLFSFQIQSISQFIGIGPDLGLSGQLEIFDGLSMVGSALVSLNVGSINVEENFSSTSTRLVSQGIGVSNQQVTTPNKIQVVPGVDGKLGLVYQFKNPRLRNLSVEAGYHIAAYVNAISTTSPQTLVQPGTDTATPEFSTGTMAIVSMTQQDRPFNLNGPYLVVKFNVLC